ncbi:MAG: hypothetical protein ACPGJV_08445 [Bacteriovoracaceae bacterium]
MTTLFIDTTVTLRIGLLGEDLSWIEYKEIPEKKTSRVIHGEVYEILKSHGQDLDSLKNLVLAKGPGSYTGIRVVKPFEDILSQDEIDCYGFYHHQVPKLLGFDRGSFFCNAYKNEFFQYSWNGDEEESKLVPKDNLLDKTADFYSNDLEYVENEKLTHELILKNEKSFFKRVKELKLNLEPFYFRPVKVEFALKEKKN